MADRPDDTQGPQGNQGDPVYPGQEPPAGSSQQGGSASHPGSPPSYPGQTPPPPYGGYGSASAQPGGYGQAPAYPGGYGQPSGYPGGYGQAPAYPGGGYDGAAPAPGWSGWAIAAFVCSLIPFLGILAAVPLAIIALVKISKTRQRGKLLAIAAMVISVLWWVGAVALGVAWFNDTAERDDQGVIVEEGRLELAEIRAGDCVDIPSLSDEGEVEVSAYEISGLPCDEPHNAEAVAVVETSGEEFPGSSALDAESALLCQAKYNESFPADFPAGVTGFRLIPTEGVWNDEGGRRSICFAVNSDFSVMEGSVTNS